MFVNYLCKVLAGSTVSTGFLKYIPVSSYFSITLQLDSKYGFLSQILTTERREFIESSNFG